MPDQPEFVCNLSQPAVPLHHVWESSVGSGHALLALRSDWQAQLLNVHQELGIQRVRFHGILDDDVGTLVDEENRLLYSFFNANQIMDFILSIGMTPIVELSFMPTTLASGSKTVFKYKGNVTPPKDFDAWDALIRKLGANWLDRYGLSEVSKWMFEVWNEPNMQGFWTGSQADYFNLYAHTARALKSVDDSLRVGGPVTAKNAWIPEFLAYTHQNQLPVDFISTHLYPTDAFGKPGADTITQLEHSQRDVMAQNARETRQQVGNLPLYYTEWSTSSNPRDPLHDEPFGAASAMHILMGVQEYVQGYGYWTFSDIFEENYFPSLPFQGGFGLLNLYGIPKPAYRAFQLLHNLGNKQFPVQGQHETVEAWVAYKEYALCVALVNHARPRHPIKTELVKVRLENAPEPLSMYVQRIDEDHANPRKAWEQMGQPEYLSTYDVEALKAASQLVKELIPIQFADGVVTFQLDLPPQSIVAVTLELPIQIETKQS